MPLIRNVISGAQVNASAKVARKFNLVIPQGTTSIQSAAQLQTNTLPQCAFYCIMTAGPAGCTFNPQWAVDNRPDGVGGIEPDWFPVTPPQVIILGVPLLFSVRLISNMISTTINVPGGGADATITIILAASL